MSLTFFALSFGLFTLGMFILGMAFLDYLQDALDRAELTDQP